MSVYSLWQLSKLITDVAAIEEVRKRRSDPEFKDIQRYIVDINYILKSFNEKTEKILDAGAGAGIFSIALAHLGFDVTAINLSDEEDRETNFFQKFDCKFIPVNLGEHRLPFSNNTFDAVLCLHVIEHLKKPFNLLAEIRRVLKPSGVLVLMTPNGAITSIYRNLLHKSLHGTDHIKEYTSKELVHMLKFSGLQVLNVGYSNEMVSASLLNTSKGIKWLLVRAYCFLCNLLPAISYELHVTAKAEAF